jgi:hypothetical protein
MTPFFEASAGPCFFFHENFLFPPFLIEFVELVRRTHGKEAWRSS